MNHTAALDTLNAIVREWERGRPHAAVLEAGGGSLSRISFEIPCHVTVIDISPEQLERNGAAVKHLGDLHTIELQERFDVVVCYDVIEHLEDPGRVVPKLCSWLAPGGLLLLAAPNRSSLAGLITRLTPHWFHVWAYRSLFGDREAGKPGRAPFPTVHHPDIDPAKLRTLIDGLPSMNVAALIKYETARRANLLARRPVIGWIYGAVLWVATLLLGKAAGESDFYLAARKRA